MASGIPYSAKPQNSNLFFIWSQARLILLFICLFIYLLNFSCELWTCELRFKYRYETFKVLGLLICLKKKVVFLKGASRRWGRQKLPLPDWWLRLPWAQHPDKGSWGHFPPIIRASCAFHKFSRCWSPCLRSLGHSGLGHCQGERTRSSCLLQAGGAGWRHTGFHSGDLSIQSLACPPTHSLCHLSHNTYPLFLMHTNVHDRTLLV